MSYNRFMAGVSLCALLVGAAGCAPTGGPGGGGGGGPYASAPPPPMSRQPAPQQGMSTKKKVLLLAGAAAVYYLYKKHQNAKGSGAQGQYYQSKNGRVYYRDAQGRPVWVTPPRTAMEVPADEFERYTGRRADQYSGRVIRERPAGWN